LKKAVDYVKIAERTDISNGISATFKTFQTQQIRLVTDLTWYEPICEQILKEIVTEILSGNKRLDKARINEISEGVIRNAEFITQLKKELHC